MNKQPSGIYPTSSQSTPSLLRCLEIALLTGLFFLPGVSRAVPFSPPFVIDQNPGAVVVEKALADINGDGCLDTIIGLQYPGNKQGIFWYQCPPPRLNGDRVLTDAWSAQRTINLGGQAYEDMAPFDVNGDGAIDIIAAYNYNIEWFQNPNDWGVSGAPHQWIQRRIGTGYGENFLGIADLDGDGKIDVATNSFLFFQNNPSSWTRVGYNPSVFRGTALLDIGSGRGRINVVSTESASPYRIAWFENPREHGGNARTDPWLVRPIGPGYTCTSADTCNDPYVANYGTGDLNGDARMDVVSVQAEGSFKPPAGGVIWWEAPSDRRSGAWTKHTIDANFISAHNVQVVDIDGDSVLDLVAAEQEQSGTDDVNLPDYNRVSVFYNNGSGVFSRQDLSHRSGHNIQVGDIDGDSDIDIMNAAHGYYGHANPIEIYVNQRTPSTDEPPSITTHPSSRSVVAGQTASFSVTASGTAPLSYQWQRNGSNIAEATGAGYTTPATALADSGAAFRCVVTSSAGAATSNTATLTVTSPPNQADVASDDFNARALNTRLWTHSNYPGGSRISVDGTNALITIPSGSAHDAWGINNSARFTQDVRDGDFEIEVKFDSAVTAHGQDQGILVEQDGANWLRFDIFHDGTRPTLFAASVVNGSATPRYSSPIAGAGAPVWIRVRRVGDTWTESYSTNGVDFTVGVTFAQTLTVSKVGPYAGTTVSSESAFTASIDYFFNTASPIDPEDGPPGPPVITGVTATPAATSATIRWTTNEPATTDVDYGVSTAYGSEAYNWYPVQSHAIGLADLNCDTVYHYRVTSSDASSNSASSSDATFRTSPCATGGGPVSDDFQGGSLNTSLWTVTNPLGDASLSFDGTNARIAIPSGPAHDAWVPNNAVRLMQTIANVDFEVVAKFDAPVTADTQEQGILIEQDSANYLRFDVYHDGTTPNIFAGSIIAGSGRPRHDSPIAAGSGPIWIRVRRAGAAWTQSYSRNGVDFTVEASFTQSLTVTKIGPFAGTNRSSPPAPGFSSSIDYFFNTASPIVPGD